MRSGLFSRSGRAIAVIVTGLVTLAGCAADHSGSTSPTSLEPGESAVSPDGVTTEVNAPAASTEEEYIAACLQARAWMEGQDGDRDGLVEAYLKKVQESNEADAGTWDTSWSDLGPERQSALIVAVRAAADEACG
ncbi:lipoprotein LpqV [Mycobacterium sp. 1274756.6]|uniref:lipoprotein LpqV n=1 Tax=Mycobacterium sp. 1274756.6 TaxID=1834076 RepID=UPI0007FE6238|nr:lipoprotein LpqV [Mycobacterium sp. 1274756.6]OBJ67912.1 hypothetical protein A5643_15595 [Mycobacterium sp. 1274756.6]